MDLTIVCGPPSAGEVIFGMFFFLLVIVGLASGAIRCLTRRAGWRDAACWLAGFGVAWPLSIARFTTEGEGLAVMFAMVGVMGAGLALRFRQDEGLRRQGARALEATALCCAAMLVFTW